MKNDKKNDIKENTIQKELKLAQNEMLKDFEFNIENKKGIKLVKITRDNVAKVEAMIRNDSAYIKSSDVNKGPSQAYGGSTAFWMTLLKNILIEHKESKYTYEKIIENAINAVDKENSTHLNADKCGRKVIKERLLNISHKDFIQYLKNPHYKDMELIKIIAKKTKDNKGGRTNISFASKFCHYACFYLFEGTKYQDNYSIYDNVMKKVLPYYLKYYKLDLQKYNLNDYLYYQQAVDDIRLVCKKETGIEISRNGFDHLLWYYHKGRL